MANAVTQDFSIRRFKPAEWHTYKTLRLRALDDSPDAFGSTLEVELARALSSWA